MRAGAEICFLGDGGARADLNLAQTVGIGPIAETGVIVQRQVPRNRDPRALMNKRFAINLRVKNAEPEKAPLVQRFWCPCAKEEPAKFPKDAEQAITARPRRFVSGTLRRINDLFLSHGSFAGAIENRRGIDRPLGLTNIQQSPDDNPLRPRAPTTPDWQSRLPSFLEGLKPDRALDD